MLKLSRTKSCCFFGAETLLTNLFYPTPILNLTADSKITLQTPWDFLKYEGS